MNHSYVRKLSMSCKSALCFMVLLQALVNSFTGWHSLKQRSATIYFPQLPLSPFSNKDDTAIMMSTRQSQSTSGNQLRKKVSQPLITSLSSSRIRIGGQRWILLRPRAISRVSLVLRLPVVDFVSRGAEGQRFRFAVPV